MFLISSAIQLFSIISLLEQKKMLTLQTENIKDVIMCTFNITLDDALLERVRPAFASEDALREWMTGR